MPNDRNTRVIQLWKGGNSMQDIATILSITRSAVAGVIHRLREGGRLEQARTTSPITKMKNQPAPSPAPDPVPEPERELPPSKPVGILDLQPHHCRAPVGTEIVMIGRSKSGHRLATYCGRQVAEGSAYCPTHIRQFFTARRQ